MKPKLLTLCAVLVSAFELVAQTSSPAKARIDLPSSKQIITPVLGDRQSLNSYPGVIALSPDGRFAALLNNGRGTGPSHLEQSIAIYDFETRKLADFPDERFKLGAKQTFFYGLAFNAKGDELYASVGSLTDPAGQDQGSLGNGIAVYSFHGGQITPSRFVKIGPQRVSEKMIARAEYRAGKGMAMPFPAGIALVQGSGRRTDRLLVANNLSDNAVLLDASAGTVEATFDLSSGKYIPTTMPCAVVISKDGKRAWVSLWNTATVAELDLRSKRVVRRINVEPETMANSSAHATAMALHPSGKLLFVTLSNRDEVAVIETAHGRPVAHIDTKLPSQRLGTSTPLALAMNSSGTRLYVACGTLNAVAVYAIRLNGRAPNIRSLGFIPTEWYPSALALRGLDLLIATAKASGIGPNNIPPIKENTKKAWAYIGDLVKGSLARIDATAVEPDLPSLTSQVVSANRMDKGQDRIDFSASGNGGNPIKHVIYIIKENRTFDQVFGDLPVGNGDKSLTMFGQDVTPNHHKLAMQFGVLDNFYDSGEVSGNGHVWSNAAITSDYTEKIWPINYRGNERTYDFEGMVLSETPTELGISDVNEPATGYIWAHAEKHGLTHRNYGEFVHTRWCRDRQEATQQNPGDQPADCKLDVIMQGDPIPPGLAPFDPLGKLSKFPWKIPLFAYSRANKPEIDGSFDRNYPNFRVEWPDQWRADEFLREFQGFVEARGRGDKKNGLPGLVVMQLPNDHTTGTLPEKPTPAAQLADNDLALGRIVEAVSNSPYWDDTAILVLEDDAQDGPDHVDAHRSLALLISRYAPRNTKPFVESGFFTTVNMIRTLEDLLGLGPMNLNDAFAPPIASLFSGKGDQPPYTADYTNANNGLLFKTNPKRNPGATQSSKMDFTEPDRADSLLLNAIIWRDRMGAEPMPAPKHVVIPQRAGSGDDE